VIRLTAVIDGEGQAPRALTFESNARTLIIGRDATADFQVPLPTISRHHARIVAQDNLYTLEDLGSTHGTRVNDKVVEAGEKKVLHSGDVINLTRAQITCAIESEKVASVDPFEGTQAVAARAVQGILGRLGDAKESAPYLRALNGSMSGTRYPLASPLTQWTLGRSTECECMLDDVNVSRRHALLKKDWSGFVVEDLGSKNGVLVNDVRIRKRRRLKNEDELTVGPVRLVFIDPDADLLDALKGVPGFEVDESHEIDDGVGAHPEPDAPKNAFGAMSHEGPESLEEEPIVLEEQDDGLGDLDPSLLEPSPERAKMEWVIASVVLLVAVLAAGLIYMMFAD
jgi:pSer/pThr/pTyr-binding forkhead associated (FHA) protein